MKSQEDAVLTSDWKNVRNAAFFLFGLFMFSMFVALFVLLLTQSNVLNAYETISAIAINSVNAWVYSGVTDQVCGSGCEHVTRMGWSFSVILYALLSTAQVTFVKVGFFKVATFLHALITGFFIQDVFSVWSLCFRDNKTLGVRCFLLVGLNLFYIYVLLGS